MNDLISKNILIFFLLYRTVILADNIPFAAGALANASMCFGQFSNSKINFIHQPSFFNDSPALSFTCNTILFNSIPDLKQSDIAIALSKKRFNGAIFYRQYGIKEFQIKSIGIHLNQKVSKQFSYGINVNYESLRISTYGNARNAFCRLGINNQINRHIDMASVLVLPFNLKNIYYHFNTEIKLLFSAKYKVNAKTNLVASYFQTINNQEFSISINNQLNKKFYATLGVNYSIRAIGFGIAYNIQRWQISNAILLKSYPGLSNHLTFNYEKPI